MQKITIGAITLFCLGLTLSGFILKSNFGQSNPVSILSIPTANTIINDNITIVYPNPESGIINLHCDKDLKSPITIKAINLNNNSIKSFNSLDTEGADRYKYVRVATADLGKGKYNIEMTDINGKKNIRKIFIEK